MIRPVSIKQFLPWGYLVGLCVYAALVFLIYLFGFINEPSLDLIWLYLKEIGHYFYPGHIVYESTGITKAKANQISIYAVIIFWVAYLFARSLGRNAKTTTASIGSIVSTALTLSWFILICLLWLGTNLRM